jgi:hypothetical protein
MSIHYKAIPIAFESSAIGSVLGGVSNSIVVGPVAGFLVSAHPLQIGSALDDRRWCRTP